jgi:hypothetical protein
LDKIKNARCGPDCVAPSGGSPYCHLCKDPFGATLGTGRVRAPIVTCSLLIVPFFSVSFLFLISRPPTAPCSTTKHLQVATHDDLRVSITVLPALTASLLHIPFLFYLSSCALEQRLPTVTDTKTLPRGSRTLLHLSHFITSFMHLHLLYSITITGTPEVAVTI